MDAIKKLQGAKGTTSTTTAPVTASSLFHVSGRRRNLHPPINSFADEKKMKTTAAPSRRRMTNHALQERLEEVLVFEILQDGGQRYRNDLNLRGLYKYVLASITKNRKKASKPQTAQAARQENTTSATIAPTTTHSPTATLPTKLIRRRRAQSVEMISNDAAHDWETADVADTTGGGGQEPTTTTTNVVTFRERLGGYLHPRDMRKLVIPFSATNKPDIIVRRHVMLLNFDPLRAIILRDRLLVLVPDGADSLLFRLEQKVRGTSGEMLLAEDFAETNAIDEEGKVEVPFSVPSTTGDTKHPDPERDAGSTERPSLVATPLSEVSAKGANSNAEEEEENKEEWDEIQGRQWIDLPFELQCLDAVLQCATELLSDDTNELQEAVQYYVQRGSHPKQAHDRGEDPRIVIRVLDDALKEMMSRVKSFEMSIANCLDEDEDMALMNLSRLLTHPERFIQPVSQNVLEEESDEPELILETHLQDAMALAYLLDLLQGQIETASELLDRKVDTARNKILEVDVIFMVAAMCLQAIHAAKAIFGMNLNSYIQEKAHLFVIVTFSALTGALCIFGVTIYILVKTNTIQW